MIGSLLVAALLILAGCAAEPDRSRAPQAFAAARDNPVALRGLLERIPKGGDLHNHLSGAIYAESYIRWAAEDGLCITPRPGACPAARRGAAPAGPGWCPWRTPAVTTSPPRHLAEGARTMAP